MTRGRWIAALLVGLVGLGVALGAGYGAWLWWEETTNSRVDETGDPAEGPVATAPSGSPNVVVAIGCTVRRDQTSVYRPELDTTPYLARMASEGAVFDDAITAAPWTRAAGIALITGNHAMSIAMTEPGPGMNQRRLPEEVRTAAEHFRSHGWATLGGTANPNLSETWNMHQGFDVYLQPQGTWSEGVRGKMPAERLIGRLAQRVEDRADGRPVYVQALFIEAHAPWPQIDPAVVAADLSVPEDVHRYRNALSGFDRAVERLHAELEGVGLTRENTIFVVVNDHGEGLSWPTHHGFAHGRYLAPSAVGGVWVMAGRGIEPDTRIAGVASQVDVFPTVAELAGIPVDDTDGHSLVPALRTGRTDRAVAFTDTWFARTNRAALYTSEVACQDDFTPGRPSDPHFPIGCFDRFEDPDHRDPHFDPGWMAELEIWRGEREIARESFRASEAELTDEERSQLKVLGYVE